MSSPIVPTMVTFIIWIYTNHVMTRVGKVAAKEFLTVTGMDENELYDNHPRKLAKWMNTTSADASRGNSRVNPKFTLVNKRLVGETEPILALLFSFLRSLILALALSFPPSLSLVVYLCSSLHFTFCKSLSRSITSLVSIWVQANNYGIFFTISERRGGVRIDVWIGSILFIRNSLRVPPTTQEG